MSLLIYGFPSAGKSSLIDALYAENVACLDTDHIYAVDFDWESLSDKDVDVFVSVVASALLSGVVVITNINFDELGLKTDVVFDSGVDDLSKRLAFKARDNKPYPFKTPVPEADIVITLHEHQVISDYISLLMTVIEASDVSRLDEIHPELLPYVQEQSNKVT